MTGIAVNLKVNSKGLEQFHIQAYYLITLCWTYNVICLTNKFTN